MLSLPKAGTIMRFTFPAGGDKWTGSCFLFRIPGKLRSSQWFRKTPGLYDRRDDDVSVGEVERIGI
jgi:hypothetical protein